MMKRIFYPLFLIISTVVFITSCTKEDQTPVYPSFDTFVQSNANLSMFTQALTKAQLQSFTTGQGPFTWFIPTNEAFAAAGVTPDSLNRMTPGQVSYLLLYQLINPTSIPLTPVLTKDMIAQNSFARTTQLGQSIYVGNYRDSFYVNGGSLLSADNRVSNGVVHIISKLNVPPVLKGNIQAILTSTGQHSLFIAALTKANRWTAVGGTAVYTILAPTDAAMTAAGYTSASITAAPVARMDSVVRYHMFSGSRLFTNDFGDNTTPGTFLNPIKTLQASNVGRKFKGDGNTTPVDVTSANNLGTNGVVHVINGVLRY